MDNSSRDRNQKSYILMRRTYDFAMGLLIIGLAMVLLLGEAWHIERIMNIDKVLRYLLAGVSFLYGGFRLYRGIKAEY
ncbi:MAG: hypothetical protein H7178_06470 [Chitinophagaceae bacterium]|nr:hypothetical protein [Chitinophagaceae bacterium]